MITQDFQQKLSEKAKQAEAIVYRFLPPESGYQKTVLEAMNYSVEAGGKRLRPLFMMASFRLFGGQGEIVEPFMAAMEMIHTYSLVHDDLPAMDNDDYRRGRHTTWKAYGEAMGVLAGDGLLNYAFETALKAFDVAASEEYPRVISALQVLAKKAGVYGMIGGQCADVEAEKKQIELTEDRLLFIHELKTAALIQSSLMIGAILAGASPEQADKMERLGYDIGVAFQIQDDILDVIGDSEELGKPVGSDAKNEKQTYVTIHGLENSRKEVERLSKEAISLLQELNGDSAFLEGMVDYLIDRRK